MTARDVIARHLDMARDRVLALEALIEDVDAVAEDSSTASEPQDDYDAEDEPKPAKRKSPKPSATRGPAANWPKVAQTLRAGPMSRVEILRASGIGPNPFLKVIEKYGPSANGQAYFRKTHDDRWELTALGLQALQRGEA